MNAEELKQLEKAHEDISRVGIAPALQEILFSFKSKLTPKQEMALRVAIQVLNIGGTK